MRRLLLTFGAVALLAACSRPDAGPSASPATTTAPAAPTTMQMPHGTTAPAATPDRTIAVKATDKLRFQPAAVQVRAGETVAFRVTNVGKLMHELVIGDQPFQAEHEQEMQQMGGKMMGDDADGVTVAPGQTKTLVYTFHQAGTLLFACHVTGHYQAGMRGTVTAA
jgi:uncharacterized cupredoxin-like copper-binding protein